MRGAGYVEPRERPIDIVQSTPHTVVRSWLHLDRCRRRPWRTIEQVELATLEYVWWWNNQRLHGELDMRTPLEVEAAYYAAQESSPPALAGQGNA